MNASSVIQDEKFCSKMYNILFKLYLLVGLYICVCVLLVDVGDPTLSPVCFLAALSASVWLGQAGYLRYLIGHRSL